MVSGLTRLYSTSMPAPPITPENISVCGTVISPRAIGRRAVRAMRESISRSTRQLTANAAPASSQIPTVAATTVFQSGRSGVARNMPMTAQNTASCVTRGLVSAQYWAMRLGVTVRVVMIEFERGSGADSAHISHASGWQALRAGQIRRSGHGKFSPVVYHAQQQHKQRGAAVMRDRNRQWPAQEDSRDAGHELQRQHDQQPAAQFM